MIKFERVSSDCHQMSLAQGQGMGGGVSLYNDVPCLGWWADWVWQRGPCTVRSHVQGVLCLGVYSDVQCIMVIVTWDPQS